MATAISWFTFFSLFIYAFAKSTPIDDWFEETTRHEKDQEEERRRAGEVATIEDEWYEEEAPSLKAITKRGACRDAGDRQWCQAMQRYPGCQSRSVAKMCYRTCGACSGDVATIEDQWYEEIAPSLKAITKRGACRDAGDRQWCQAMQRYPGCQSRSVAKMCYRTCGACSGDVATIEDQWYEEEAPSLKAMTKRGACRDAGDRQWCQAMQRYPGCQSRSVAKMCYRTCGAC